MIDKSGWPLAAQYKLAYNLCEIFGLSEPYGIVLSYTLENGRIHFQLCESLFISKANAENFQRHLQRFAKITWEKYNG